jgi:hypothetical protein
LLATLVAAGLAAEATADIEEVAISLSARPVPKVLNIDGEYAIVAEAGLLAVSATEAGIADPRTAMSTLDLWKDADISSQALFTPDSTSDRRVLLSNKQCLSGIGDRQ